MGRITYPECGKIINTHGTGGAVKVEPWCDSPEVFAALPAVYLREGGELRALPLRNTAVFAGRFVFAELEGIDSVKVQFASTFPEMAKLYIEKLLNGTYENKENYTKAYQV
ncbi:MAG: hypothetical protein IKM08_02595, partial [Clostridia bacterium]|nr:hypothetical protein [Clostridia bacterium]